MRLTLCLLRRTLLPPGHIFRGKKRLVKRVEPPALRRLEYDLNQELHNMNYLRFPYLTQEESSGHAKALGKTEAKKQQMIDQNRSKYKSDISFEDRLFHLKVTEGWDV